MEWIKAKYDRLLLGIFGAIALIIGGLLVMKVLSFKKQFPAHITPPLRSEFGTDEALDHVKKAKIHLAEPVVFKPPVKDGKPVNLFTSAPVLKTADSPDPIAILDPKAKQVRPPIDNIWLYENDLNMQRADIATADDDKDGYNNTEEFLAKTNPRDKSSTPGIQTKLEYKECVKDPLTLKINTYFDKEGEIQFRRTEPAATAFNTPMLKAGQTFSVEKGGGEPRFKLVKIIDTPGKQVAVILNDLAAPKPETPIDLEKGKLLEMPSRRAKLVCKLGKEEEKTVSEKEDFSFAAEPNTQFKVIKITDDEVTLEFTPAGGKDKIQKTYKIPPPP